MNSIKITLALLFILLSQFTTAQTDTSLLRIEGLIHNESYSQAWSKLSKTTQNNSRIVSHKIKAAFHTQHYRQMFANMKKLKYNQQHLYYFYGSKYYVQSQNHDSAFFMLTQLLKLRRKPKRSTIKTDPHISRLKTHKNWDSLWKLDHYKPYDLKLEMAERELSVKNYDLALTLLDELIDDKPYKEKPWYLRSLLFFERGITKSALNDINRAIQEDDDEANFYNLKAKILLKRNNPRRALRSASKALKADPVYIEAYKTATKAAKLSNQYKEALHYATLYHSAYPHKPKALYRLAELIFKNGSCMKALPYINKAIQKQPHNPDFYYLRAKIYQDCKVYEQAAKNYGMCLDFWPRNGPIYLKRGICRHHLGKKKASCRDLKKGFNLGALEAKELIRSWCN